MVTNNQILKTHIKGGSPLGDWLNGRIDRPTYQQRVSEKWAREGRLSREPMRDAQHDEPTR
jgi:hypothetical protein